MSSWRLEWFTALTSRRSCSAVICEGCQTTMSYFRDSKCSSSKQTWTAAAARFFILTKSIRLWLAARHNMRLTLELYRPAWYDILVNRSQPVQCCSKWSKNFTVGLGTPNKAQHQGYRHFNQNSESYIVRDVSTRSRSLVALRFDVGTMYFETMPLVSWYHIAVHARRRYLSPSTGAFKAKIITWIRRLICAYICFHCNCKWGWYCLDTLANVALFRWHSCSVS